MEKSEPKLDRAKLFGFSQVEKVKSDKNGERAVDRSAKIGTETGEKSLWSKVGNSEV